MDLKERSYPDFIGPVIEMFVDRICERGGHFQIRFKGKKGMEGCRESLDWKRCLYIWPYLTERVMQTEYAIS